MSTATANALIEQFDHVSITVADLDATCRFYARALDARVDADYKVDGRTTVRRVLVGKAVLNIHQQGNGVQLVARRPTPGSADLCFRWSGTIESAVEHLQARNIPIIEGPSPRITSDGRPSQSVYFTDPDGNLLELMAV
jgi:catechol 2,3-dioxygenase-like lactoylglutathione lyase family enzyme